MFKIRPEIEEILKKIPKLPGVYIMKDVYGRIIYVGKSKELKNRVVSYFRGFNSHSPKTQTLVVNITDIEYIITDTEEEALALEANLIKKNRPKFNVLLKDDKQYPYIMVTLEDDFPRVVKTREIKNTRNKYFGPYSSNYAVNEILEEIHKNFQIRKCDRNLSKVKRPCLNYHIKKCIGPCIYGDEIQAEYTKMIDEIIVILNGNQKQLIKQLEKEMQESAENMAFEKAIRIRDKIISIKSLKTEQKVVNTNGIDQDIIGVVKNKDNICITVFFVREGKLIDHQNFIIDELMDSSYDEIIRSFIYQFYSDTSFVPKEIIIENNIEDINALEEYLYKLRKKKTSIIIPQKGDKKRLVNLVLKNANEYLDKYLEKHNSKMLKYDKTIEELNQIISIGEIERIEAYDISNIYGVFNVGTMIVYENGARKKNDYRKFKIKSVNKIDDYGSMREVLGRRFSRLIDEYDEQSFSKWPQLILLDGGKGQVSVVKEVMDSYGLNIPIIGMFKDQFHRTKGLIYEGEEYVLDKSTLLYKLIFEIQEEVHRFAINYHKTLRGKSVTSSILEDIPGVGKKRREELLKHFENITMIQNATLEELMEVPSVDKKTALEIKKHFIASEKNGTV
jgi:excinuclease ABC subunit C